MLLSKKQQDICYVTGIVLASGIGILNVTTPSVYLAAPVILSTSLVEIGNTIFCLFVLVSVSGVYVMIVLVALILAFLLP